MNTFNKLQQSTFHTVTRIFGETATWKPADGGNAQTANVLFKNPSEAYKIGEGVFEIDEYMIEFKEGDFPGLKLSVNAGNLEEVEVHFKDTSVAFYIRKCTAKFDGKTITATLNIK